MAVAQPWTPSSWRALHALQQPDWPDPAAVEAVRERLGQLPPLVFAGEARALRRALGEAGEGRAFLLQAGDCAESFRQVSAVAIRERLKVLLQMSAVLTYGATLPVVKVGRIAGQFTKPRTSLTERVGGVDLPSFRGHAIHSDADPEARVPDPERMVQAYYQAVSTLNLLRAFTKGGFADLTQVHTWNQEFVSSSLEGRRYEVIANEIGRALRFMQAIGIDLGDEGTIHEVDVWTSHEALLLDYEEPLVRRTRRRATGTPARRTSSGSASGRASRTVRTSSSSPVSRTRSARRSGRTRRRTRWSLLAERLNPGRIPGRLTFVSGWARTVREACCPLVRAVRESVFHVLWACDPMHANTFVTPSGHKTRRFDDVLARSRVLRRPSRGRVVARRRPPRDHGRERDGVPRRVGGGARGAARPPVRDALRPAAQRAAVARPGVPRRGADAGRVIAFGDSR